LVLASNIGLIGRKLNLVESGKAKHLVIVMRKLLTIDGTQKVNNLRVRKGGLPGMG
jgi:hypothetical protein